MTILDLKRSLRVSKAVYDALEKSGLEIIDATCPFVKRIHKIVKQIGNKSLLTASVL